MMLRCVLVVLAALAQDQAARKESHLGAETRAPTKQEAREYSLPGGVRAQGQLIESVEAGSPADKAGLAKGDVILKLNDNRIYSRDSLEDFLRVTRPGTEIKVTVKRAKTYKEEEIRLTLGERETKERRILWQYASLEQLDAALAHAKKDKKKVLVGISGAET